MAEKNKKAHPRQERTFLMVKPDGVKRGLVGETISRLERRGLKVIALSMVTPTRKQIDDHYPKSEAWITRLGEKTLNTYAQYNWDPVKEMGTKDPSKIGKEVRNWILDYMTSGPVVKMVVEGIHAIDMVRKICGNTMPYKADMGTIRGDFSIDSAALANREKRAIYNLVHASETSEEVANEMSRWIAKDEIHDYKRSDEDVMF